MKRGHRLAVVVAVAGLLICGSAAAQDGAHPSDYQIALFQTKNIFHSGLRGTHTVALTFDDGPNAYTPAVVAALNANNVNGTFFIVGRMAQTYPDLLREIAVNGNQLANHTANHRFMGKRYDSHPEMLLAQIREVNNEIAPYMPAGAKLFFRSPYGQWTAQHAAILNADPLLRNYVGPIYWDVGGQTIVAPDGYVLASADWNCWKRRWTADVCAKGYLREIRRRNGGVVLMHCIYSESAALVNAVVPPLVEEGYRFVRLDQDPAYDRYETPPLTPAPAETVIASSHMRPGRIATIR